MKLDAIFNIDRRVVFVFVFLSLLIPLLVPYAMPCKPTDYVQAMYDAIEHAAAANKPVFLSFEFDPTGAAEQEPMARAIVRHLFARGGKAVVMCKSGGQLGEALHLQILEDCAQEYGKTYGEDYVYLPFLPGSTNLVINLGKSLESAWPKDYRGRDLSQITLTRNITRLADFDYVMVICSSLTTVVDWITYGQQPYNLRMGFGVLGNVTPDVTNYVQSGQIVGLLGGLIGAAQYEQILVDKEMGLLRRFSAADLVRSQLPSLCGKLIDPKAPPVTRSILNSLAPEAQKGVRETATRKLDMLDQDGKRAIAVALNTAITRSDVISEADLGSIKATGRLEELFGKAEADRVRRRLFVENLFPKELTKAQAAGQAMRWMTPQSIAHVVLIVAILFGNVCFLWERIRSRRKGQA